MSKINENEIKKRFEAISKYEISPDITTRDLEQVRKNLTNLTSEQKKSGHNIWSIIMKSNITKLATAAVIVIAAIIILNQFGGPKVSSFAWADVIEPILNARTAVLDIIVGDESNGGPVIHDQIKGSLIRRTVSNLEDNIVLIDLEAGKVLSMSVSKKEAAYVDLKGIPSFPNYLDSLRNVIIELQKDPDFQVEELGTQNIDGQEVIGFLAKHPKANLTIWADAETGLPIRVEQVEGQVTTICKNVKFDVQMDDSQFSMDVPDGYKLEQVELDLMGSTEEDFIEGLRVQAEVFGDGFFPDGVAIEDYIKEAPELEKKMEELGLSDDEEMELGLKINRHLLFIRFFKGQGQWHYAGQGVKLGDSETPIFWYHPQDSQTWRVIYGDLKVSDVEPENLP